MFTMIASLLDRLLRPGRDWVLVSVAMYLLACVLPAINIGSARISGFECLISMMFFHPSWWANPTYFVAVIASLLNRTRTAVVFAVVAALLAVFYILEGFYNHGVTQTMNGLEPGCHVWIASLLLLAWHELWRQWQKSLDRGPDESA
ncbi:MAG: hypothetical protein AABP62_08340 [Planctomycetota bacterium]